jgi:ATP phosphoribosyltransferase
MLRLAVPNKGSLHGPATQMLAEAGYRVHREHKALLATDPDNHIQPVFLRPMDIARNVGSGILDAGITGQDLLAEAGTAQSTTELLELDFGHAEFFFAAPHPINATDLDGKRVATSFPRLVQQAATRHGIELDVVSLDGAGETAMELGLAEAIADVVETGTSLRAAGLVTVGEPILRSQAVLVRGRRELPADSEQIIEVLIQRITGVLHARQYVMMEYNCPIDALDPARRITPGHRSPTISRLDEEGWVAVRVMVRRNEAHAVMDQLKQTGAIDIVATRLEACRL